MTENENAGAATAPQGGAKRWLWLNAAGLLAALLILAFSLNRGGAPVTQVVAFSPRSEADAAAAAQVEVEFSAPLDPASVTPGSLFLSPAAEGAASLGPDNKRLIYKLAKPLAAATDYRVGLSLNLRDAAGRPVSGGAQELAFGTPALKVEGAEPVSFDINSGFVLELRFNNPVAPEVLAKALRIYPATAPAAPGAAAPKPAPLRFNVISRVARAARVRLPGRNHAQVRLCLPAGLTGVDGPKGLAADCELDVDLLALAQQGAGVRFLGMRTENDWRTNGTRVIVRANVPLEAARAPEFVTITPDVPHGFAFHGDGLAITGDFRPGVRYEIALKKGFSAGALGALDHDVVRSVWCGDREASLDFAYGGGVFTPAGLQKLPIESVSVKEIKIEAERMYASNLVAWALCDSDWRRKRLMRALGQKTIAVRDAGNAKSETLLDLREIAKGLDPEHAVEPARTGVYFVSARAGDSWRGAETVAVVTDLGLTLHAAKDSAVCWVTSLATAAPLAGVAVKAYSSASQEIAAAVTDAEGVARLALPQLPEGEFPAVVTAEKDGDLSYLLFNDRAGGRVRDRETTSGREIATVYSVFSTPERGAYRPGETARLSALARDAASNRVAADLWLELKVTNANGRKLFAGKAKTDAAGRVALDVPIPDAAPSGLCRCQWALPGEKETLGEATFRVADFIPPTLKMTVSAADGALPAAQPLAVVAKVNHLFGAPAANLPVQCLCEFRAAPFVPRGREWKEYAFNDAAVGGGRARSELMGVLDAAGAHTFKVAAPAVATSGIVKAALTVTALENGGRGLSERLERSLFPLRRFVGVKLPDGARAGDFNKIPVAVLDAGDQGEALATGETQLKAELFRVVRANVLRRNGQGGLTYDWTRSESKEADLAARAANGRGEIVVNPRFAGEYRLRVSAPGARAVSVEFYAAGADGAVAQHSPDESPRAAKASAADGAVAQHSPDEIAIALDKQTYRPGDNADCVLQAPFAGTALVCVEGNDVKETRVVRFEAGKNHVVIPVKEEWRPNVYVTAAVVRPVAAEANWQPHRATGEAVLRVDCADKKLNVNVEVPAELRPAAQMRATVKVADAAGSPVANAAVVLAAVDSGTLSLTGFASPAPFDFFYAKRALMVRDCDLYGRLAPELSRWKAGAAAAPGGGAGADAAMPLSPIKAKRVKTAVLYAGILTTDANGVATADFTLPEYAGELRFMAYAAADDRFGSASREVPVQSPLLFRASWPRFAATGDVFSVPVTVFNRTKDPMEVIPALTLGEGLALQGELPGRLTIPALGEAPMTLTVKASGYGAATATLAVHDAADKESYRESVELAVRPAAGRGDFRGGTTVEPGQTAKVVLPGEFLPDTGSARLVVAGNPLAPAAAAVRGLLDYPYGCLEQTTSRLLPLLRASDLVAALESVPGQAATFGREEIQNLLDKGFQRFELMRRDGGLAMWPGAAEPWDWGTLYALDLMGLAKKEGYRAPEDLRAALLDYAANHLDEWVEATDKDGRATRLPEAAYAVAVLTDAGRAPYSWMTRLEEKVRVIREKKDAPLPVSVAANLARAYLALGKPELAKELWKEAPDFLDGRMDGGSLASLVGDTAMALSTLLDVDPQSPRVPEMARGLAEALAKDATTTFENAAAFAALAKYARGVRPDPEGKVTLKFADGRVQELPMAQFAVFTKVKPGETVEVTVAGKSPACLSWFTSGQNVAAAAKEEDHGVAIRREFRDLAGNPVAPDAFKSGQLYHVTLTVTTQAALRNCVVVDMLPAGLEIENQDLRTSAKVKPAPGAAGRELFPNHVEPRDDRLLIFADVPAASCRYTYLVRAVAPGKFALPAVEIGSMYDPMTLSRHGAGTITVK